MTVSASAEAIFDEAMDGSACILSLDETATHALKTSGNVTVSMPNCGVAVNSEDEEALYLNGSVLVDVADVRIHGGYATDGNVDFQYDTLRTGTSPVADPYEDLGVPSYSACSTANKKKGNKYTANATLNPGVYCGGITISGNTTMTFNPGVYILDGGDFKVTGGGSMTGTGVSFVLTNSSSSGGSYGKLDISGGRTINFSAPASGKSMEGVVFYQDRNAPSTAANSITGTAEIKIDGAAYFPATEITYGGTASNTSTSNPCSRIIGRLVTFHGTPHIANSCDGSAALTINMPGTDTIRLVN